MVAPDVPSAEVLSPSADHAVIMHHHVVHLQHDQHVQHGGA